MSQASNDHHINKRRRSAVSKEKADNDRADRNRKQHHMRMPATLFDRGYSDRSIDEKHLWHAVVKAKVPRGSLGYWRQCSKRAQQRLSARQEAGMGLCDSKTKAERKPKPKTSKKPASTRKSRSPNQNNRRHVRLTDYELQEGVARMKAANKARALAATQQRLDKMYAMEEVTERARLAPVQAAVNAWLARSPARTSPPTNGKLSPPRSPARKSTPPNNPPRRSPSRRSAPPKKSSPPRRSATEGCTRIVDAIASFCYDDLHPYTFDIFVEVDPTIKTNDYDSYTLSQINQVRIFLQKCILSKECALRVHWADPKGIGETEHQLSNPHATLATFNLSMYDIPAFKKEIAKAKLADSMQQWSDRIREYASEYARVYGETEEEATYTARRIMMDLYAMSRIMKPSEKPSDAIMNVVYYAGAAHTQFAAQICRHLGFTQEWYMEEISCYKKGSSVRKMPLGTVFDPPVVLAHERNPHGEAARLTFNAMCDKHFGSKKLVGVLHSARWFNKGSGQTIYFLGESHVDDRAVGYDFKPDDGLPRPDLLVRNIKQQIKQRKERLRKQKEEEEEEE